MADEASAEPDTMGVIGSSPPRRVPVLGICGGSGAGKTHLVGQIRQRCVAAGLQMAHVSFDVYYHDLSHLSLAERRAVNFDHPDSLDGELLAGHIRQLAAGDRANIPLYDFATYTRTGETVTAGPADLVVVDGILLAAFAPIREVIDVGVYLDVPDDLRHDRRVARDTVERGREVADVERQWNEFVEPMHRRYVEPSAAFADLVVRYGEDRDALLDTLMHRVATVTGDDGIDLRMETARSSDTPKSSAHE